MTFNLVTKYIHHLVRVQPTGINACGGENPFIDTVKASILVGKIFVGGKKHVHLGLDLMAEEFVL